MFIRNLWIHLDHHESPPIPVKPWQYGLILMDYPGSPGNLRIHLDHHGSPPTPIKPWQIGLILMDHLGNMNNLLYFLFQITRMARPLYFWISDNRVLVFCSSELLGYCRISDVIHGDPRISWNGVHSFCWQEINGNWWGSEVIWDDPLYTVVQLYSTKLVLTKLVLSFSGNLGIHLDHHGSRPIPIKPW